jgi:hypothetical protein
MKDQSMTTTSGVFDATGRRGWYVAFVFFLMFLVPVTPILAEIPHDTPANSGSTMSTGVAPQTCSHRHVPTYFVALDLLGRAQFHDPATAWYFVPPEQTACDEGRLAADRETSRALWFVLGFALNMWGVLLAYIVSPSVPSEQLTGRTDGYAADYHTCYSEMARSIHVKWAWYGLGSLAAVILVWGIVSLIVSGKSGFNFN